MTLEDYQAAVDAIRPRCRWCCVRLTGSVQSYPHDGGWEVDGERRWLYIQCPRCSYQWALWKLGISIS